MRKFSIAIAAALAAATATSTAYASPVINYTPNVGATFGNLHPIVYPPHFNDVYDFATSYARSATVTITSDMTLGDFSTNVNFVSNGVLLNAELIPATSTGVHERRYLANFRIPAGAQQIIVRGSAGAHGAYTGLLTLSGVPEPETLALFGLGILGLGLTRRRKQR